MASPTPIWARFWVLFGVYFIVAILQKRPRDWATYSAAHIAIAIGLSSIGASVAATPLLARRALGSARQSLVLQSHSVQNIVSASNL